MRRSMAYLIVLAVLAVFPGRLVAQSFGSAPIIAAKRHNRIAQFIKTHKVEVIEDAIVLGSSASESVTSQACLNAMFLEQKKGFAEARTSSCSKQGYLALKVAPFNLAAIRLMHRYAPDHTGNLATAVVFAPFVYANIRYTKVNIDQTDFLRRNGNPFPPGAGPTNTPVP